MNCVNLIGRITKDPELKTTTNGKYVCSFSIAVQRPYKNKDTGEYDVDFINIRAWESHAEFVTRYFHKGQRIGITGSLRVSNYTDKNGNNVTWTEVVADGIDFADGKQTGTAAANEQANRNTPPSATTQQQYTTAAAAPPPAQTYNNEQAEQPNFSTAEADDNYPF